MSTKRSSGSSPFLIRKKRARPLSDIHEEPEFTQSFSESRACSDMQNLVQGFPRSSTPEHKNVYVEPKVKVLEMGVLSPDSPPPIYQQSMEVDIEQNTYKRKKNITVSTTPFARRLSLYSTPTSSEPSQRRNITVDSSLLFEETILRLEKSRDLFDTIRGIEPLDKYKTSSERTTQMQVLSKKDTSIFPETESIPSNKSETFNRTSDSETRLSLILSPMRSDDREPTPPSLEMVPRHSSIDVFREKQSLEKSSSFEHFTVKETSMQLRPRKYLNYGEDSPAPSSVAHSIRSMPSMVLPPERSNDVFSKRSTVSTISYISSTTTLFDLVANSKLDYTIATPSDTTGSEDYSIVFNRRYQKDIQKKEQKKQEEALRKIQEQQLRKDQFEMFSIKGITWSVFSSEHIRFSLRPKDIFPANFSSKRLYTFSMRFNGKFWAIRTFRVPERQEILKTYNKYTITDRNVQQFFKFVVGVIHRNINLEKIYKEEREEDYFAGVEMDLNDSDLELFLNEEERKDYLERREKLWKGMMSPSNC